MTMRDDQCFILPIAKRLCRSASTIGRELKRTAGAVAYASRIGVAAPNASALDE